MSKFIITSDTTCDLPKDFCKSNNIDIHPLYYRFGDNEVYGGDKDITPAEFYKRMRDGEMPTTMATNPEASREIFESRLRIRTHVLQHPSLMKNIRNIKSL